MTVRPVMHKNVLNQSLGSSFLLFWLCAGGLLYRVGKQTEESRVSQKRTLHESASDATENPTSPVTWPLEMDSESSCTFQRALCLGPYCLHFDLTRREGHLGSLVLGFGISVGIVCHFEDNTCVGENMNKIRQKYYCLALNTLEFFFFF